MTLAAARPGPGKQWEGTTVPEYTPADLVQKWEEFFDAFDYAGRILSIADAYPESRTLEVPFDEVNRFDTDFAIYFLRHPQTSVTAGEEAVTRIAPPGDVPIRVHLRVKGLPRDLRIMVRDLRAEHLGQFVTVEGLVRKATEVRPKIVDATFQCLRCNSVIKEPQEGQSFREPLECYEDQGGCGRSAASTKFKLIGETSMYLDTQKIEIQEPPEILRGGEEPQRLEAYMEDDIAGLITPGERIVLNGVLRSAQRGRPGARSTIFDIFVDVNSVEKERVEFEEIEITQQDLELIKEEARRPNIVERIVQSIAPTIFGLDKEKEALALQLFGGVPKLMPDGTRIRGDIHLILVGDPGAAKSQLLAYMAQIAPRGIMVSGKGTSAAGLLAAAVKDEFGEGRWTLEAGALVLADRGLACLHPDSEVVIEGVPRPVGELFDAGRAFPARAMGHDLDISPLGLQTVSLSPEDLQLRTGTATFVTRRRYAGEIVCVTVESGSELRLTPDHLVLDGEALCWRPIGKFALGDRLVAPQRLPARSEAVYETPGGTLQLVADPDYALDRIVRISRVPYEGYVYDLRVPDEENFLCDGVIVHNCIDEIEKMSPQDRGSIHTAMEEQMVHIAKAGITATLPTRCAVLAAANPQFGRFVRGKYIYEQINLEPALLSRFDGIFPVMDIPQAERDRQMAEHILHAHRLGEIMKTREELGEAPATGEIQLPYVPYFLPEFLRKYVAYAKRIYPVMTPDALNRIRDNYLEIRKLGEDPTASVPITPRQLEAFVRLAEASARARLSPLVDVEDADRAVGIIEYWLRQVAAERPEGGLGTLDIDIITTGVAHSQRDQMVALRDIIAEVGGRETDRGASHEDILELAERRGVPRDRVEAWLRKWVQDGELYVPSAGRYKLVARL